MNKHKTTANFSPSLKNSQLALFIPETVVFVISMVL